ncbi:MAG: 2,3-bisphosphoglycerate-independent phosphoglycerate mutase, partial [Clostridiales bacterium]|nr:2,3-bisphosphoglycerate-independent phosphoglycerate mutase [Clostridiales bacterium]
MSNKISMSKPTVALIVLDGFGISDSLEYNAIAKQGIKNIKKLMKNYPHTTLKTSGRDVGLPAFQMGNSEVGHLNIGAGRIVYQDITAIDKAIEDSEFFNNEAFLGAARNCKENNSSLHLVGLLSDGGVHSSIEHLFALLQFAKDNKLENVYIHCILDGRDVAPQS